MKIKVSNYSNLTANTLLLPIENNPNLKTRLVALAEKFDLNQSFIQDFTGKHKEVLPLYTNENQPAKLFLIGLGSQPSFIKVREAMRSFSFHNKSKLGNSVAIDVSSINTELTEAIMNGLELSTYNIHLYQTSEHKNHPLKNNTIEVIIDENNQDATIKAIEKGVLTGETQKEAFDLVNQDAGHLTPEALGEWAKNSGKKYGYNVTVYGKKAIEEMGLKAYLAVNRGSEFAPAFIVAEYKSKAVTNPKKIGLVGKGVTFDTGGLNIKTAGMHYMKSDMGGSAAVLGTIELVAKLQLPVHLIVIVPATDNCVDALSIRPSDVIGSFSSKTIEVIDTDAEGRLTLADGVAYMIKNYEPEILIDVATLTGASVRALGLHAGALFSSNPTLAKQLQATGEKIGERLWELPLYEEFMAELKSDIADITNLGSRPMAGASTAAKFIQYFTSEHPNWAHLDIAGVAYGDSEYSKQKAGKAFGINLLTEYIKGAVS
jgi:leucyl aminopeptidase